MQNIIIKNLKHKKLATLTFLILMSVSGIAALASVGSENPEIKTLQGIKASSTSIESKNKAGSLPALKEEESRLNSSKSVKEGEINSIESEKNSSHEEELKKEEQVAEGSSFLGRILDGDKIPSPFYDSEFVVLNSWRDKIGGDLVAVFSGYRTNKPSKGIVYVFDKNGSKSYSLRSVPMRIVSASGGILTLQSEAKQVIFDVNQRKVF